MLSFCISEHVSHSYAKKIGAKLSHGRSHTRTIHGEKCNGSDQTCGVTGNKREILIDRVRAKKLGLCGNTIVKKGCYLDVQIKLGGKMLIDDEDRVHRTVGYSDNMHE